MTPRKSFKSMIASGEVKRADAMKVRFSDLHLEPDFNVRLEGQALEDHIEGIKQFILDGGVLPPIEVRPREEGGVWVVDGHCRTNGYQRAIDAGAPIEWVEVRAFTGNDVDRVARMVTSNEGLKLSPLETSLIYKRLRGMGLEVQEIAKRVNRTPQHVAQILVLADANHDVQQAVVDGVVSASTAIELTKEHGENTGEVVKKLVVKAAGKGRTRVTRAILGSVKLSAQEVRAVNALIAEYHEKWKKLSADFLDDDERRNLEGRLDDAM